MNVKRMFLFLLILLLMLSAFPVNANEIDAPEFRYELTVNGKDVVEAHTGELITVTLNLYRTDADQPYTMYGTQAELYYDSTFFELDPDSIELSKGVEANDIGLVDGNRELYMNYVSFTGGETWKSKTRIGTFQLRVTGESGVSTITNEDFLVSLPDGSGSYACDANVLTVILTTECTVKFESNGGTPIDPVKAYYGEKLDRPEDPVREGKYLVGWFRDIQLTEEWDFESDVITGNMTLYAKWADEVPVDADDPIESDDLYCMICGSACDGILGVAICGRCLLIILLFILLLFFRRKKKNGMAQQSND